MTFFSGSSRRWRNLQVTFCTSRMNFSTSPHETSLWRHSQCQLRVSMAETVHYLWAVKDRVVMMISISNVSQGICLCLLSILILWWVVVMQLKNLFKICDTAHWKGDFAAGFFFFFFFCNESVNTQQNIMTTIRISSSISSKCYIGAWSLKGDSSTWTYIST